jgi:hypothetical protein
MQKFNKTLKVEVEDGIIIYTNKIQEKYTSLQEPYYEIIINKSFNYCDDYEITPVDVLCDPTEEDRETVQLIEPL